MSVTSRKRKNKSPLTSSKPSNPHCRMVVPSLCSLGFESLFILAIFGVVVSDEGMMIVGRFMLVQVGRRRSHHRGTTLVKRRTYLYYCKNTYFAQFDQIRVCQSAPKRLQESFRRLLRFCSFGRLVCDTLLYFYTIFGNYWTNIKIGLKTMKQYVSNLISTCLSKQ